MEGGEESEYDDGEELTLAYDSDNGERATHSNPENDSILMDEASVIWDNSGLEDAPMQEEGGEDFWMMENDPGRWKSNIDDRIYGWDAEVAENEYPGEYRLEIFEEDEKKPDVVIPPTLKRESLSLMSTKSESERSKTAQRVKIHASVDNKSDVDRLRVVRVKPKPCIKDRMRKWLNRDHGQPPTESFLGRPYSERSRSLTRLDNPCCHIFFKRFARAGNQVTENVETSNTDTDVLGRRPTCVCHGRIEEPPKQQTVLSKQMTTEQSRSLVNDHHSSGEISNEPRKRIKCTCGQSEECLGWSQTTEKTTVDCPVVIETTAEETSKDQVRKSEKCTCDEKGTAGGVQAEDADAEMREKLHHLLNLWFELKQRVCHCRKTGWMTTRVWERRKEKKCICKRIRKKRRKLLRMMKEAQNEILDKHIEMTEQNLRDEKINDLYKTIGPALAAEYKELSERHHSHKKKESDSFTRMIMNEFGAQLRKYRMQNLEDGSIHREHRKGDHDSLQYVELPNGSKYYGQFSRLGMEGKCIYKMVHGPVFVGSMVDGKMEGQGQLIFPNGGIVEGTWVNGTLFDPKYTFSDGLKFQPYNWKYCRMPDRRFVSEIVNGMNSPGNVQLSADHPARQIPKGCLDAGEGFYDPQKRVIIHPSTGKIIRIVGEQEGNWILQNCRREWFEEVPFSRYMYENWYAGTVFPPPGDEPEWFEKEFAKVLLPYTNVADVVQARGLAMNAASKPTPGPQDPGYAKAQVLPPMSLN